MDGLTAESMPDASRGLAPVTGAPARASGADPDDGHSAQRERELALLEEAAQFLASSRRLEDVYPVIVRAAALIAATSATRWRASYLALEGDVLRRVAIHDEAGIDLSVREYPLADYPALQRVVTTCEPLSGDAGPLSSGIPPEAADEVGRAGLASAAMLPVAYGGEVFGILALSSREVAPARDVPFRRLHAIAHLGALAIANARLFAEQQEVAARARAVEVAKTRFLNLAAHEMRGPVTVLRGYISMLADGTLGPLTPPMRDALAMLTAKADEMNRLVTDMVETARLEEGRLELAATDVDLREVVAQVVATVSPLIGEAHVLTVVESDLALPVRGDPGRLATIVGNLLDNASKYSPAGTPIEVRCSATAQLAVVAVSDRGIGLSEEDQAVLFTRFGRVVSPLTSHIPGTGLGLWLSRELARMHGGDIDVSSQEGEGSTFSLVLPLHTA